MTAMTQTAEPTKPLQNLAEFATDMTYCGIHESAKAQVRFVAFDVIRDRCGHCFNNFLRNTPAEYEIIIDERTDDSAYVLDSKDN